MKALYVILGALLVWIGGNAAFYHDARLYKIVFPALVAAAVMIFDALRTRNKLEVFAGAGALFIAAAWATGYFYDAQALGWTVGWLIVSGLIWVFTGVTSPERQAELFKVIAVRRAAGPHPAPPADPFGAVGAQVYEVSAPAAPAPIVPAAPPVVVAPPAAASSM